MRAPAGTMWVRSIVVVAVLTAAVSCSDDPPSPGAVRTSTPTVTSSSPSPSVTPVEAQVEAAVRAYYAELTRAAQTNDTSKLKDMLAQSCPCYRAVRVIDAGAKQGERTPDALWTLKSVRIHDVTGRAAVAEVRYQVSAYDVLDKAGEVTDHISSRRSHLDLSVVQSSEQWVIANVFDLEGS